MYRCFFFSVGRDLNLFRRVWLAFVKFTLLVMWVEYQVVVKVSPRIFPMLGYSFSVLSIYIGGLFLWAIGISFSKWLILFISC